MDDKKNNDLSNLRVALQELSELRRRVYSTTQLSTVSRACNNLVEYCTQKVDPFLDGFGEVNPWKRSANKSGPEASKRSRDIDQLLVPSNKVQIVCLAAPESGFDDVLRKINLGRSLTTTELDECKRYLKQNMLTVLRYVTKLAGPSLSEHNRKLHKKLLRDDHGTNFDGIMTTNIADALRSLWTDPAVQHVYNTINSSALVTDMIGHLTIDGIVKYVDHLQDPSFAPTILDAAHFFEHTTGIREVNFQSDKSSTYIQLLDFTNLPVVGEGEFCNHSWVSQFENSTFIFCYVPLHTYDEKLDHEPLPSNSKDQTSQQSNPHTSKHATLTDPNLIKTSVTNLIKSTSTGTSLPSSKPTIARTQARANSTNARYTSSSKSTIRPTHLQNNMTTVEQTQSVKTPTMNDIPPTIDITSPTIDVSPPITPPTADTTPSRESSLPPQITGFDVASNPQNDQLSQKRKSLYHNSMFIKPSTPRYFIRRTVQEKHKSVHVAASHRLTSSPSTTPTASLSISPLLCTHSPPSPPSPPSPSSSPFCLIQPSQTQPPPPFVARSSSIETPQSKPRKLNKSFLIINSSPPPSTPSSPSSPPRASLLGPSKAGRRMSWDTILSPLDRMRVNATSIIPPPSLNHSQANPSYRKSTHERNSVSYGSLAPLSLIALPATPTLADTFKLSCYLKRFSALVNDESLLHIPVLVTFVVTSSFSEKIKDIDLDVCFPEYQGDHTEESALAFIKKIFMEQNVNPTRKIITSVTNNNDPTSEIKSILTNAIATQLYQ